MHKNTFIYILLTVIIVATFGIAGYFALQNMTPRAIPKTAITPTETTSTGGNSFSTNLDGYAQSCGNDATLYKHINNVWERVSNTLPGKGLYYLDDKFIGYGSCDYVVCSPLPKPYTVSLVEYKETGEKIPPSDSGSTANTVPVYQTVPLQGDIRIDIQYFSDKSCQEKIIFSTIEKR